LNIGSGDNGAGYVRCPTGKRALGGGVSVDNGQVYVIDSAPTDGETGWDVWLHNASSSAVTAYAWVICAYVAS